MFDYSFKDLSKLINSKIINKEEKWTWARNSPCKYIMIRVDTRDGMCMLMNRDGEEISLEQLLYQHQGGEWKV